MKTSLDHLSKEEIANLKERYYRGEPVYKLVNEYDLNVSPSMFHNLFPPEQVVKYGCSGCKVNLVVDALPRTKQNKEYDKKQFFCPLCGRKPFAEKCGWIVLPLLSDEEIANKRKQIHEYFEKKVKPIDYDKLSLTLKIYLAVLCKALLGKDKKTISPLNESGITVASTIDLQQKIYAALIKSRAIVVSSESPLYAFDTAGFPHNYDRAKVSYNLNLINIPQNAMGLETINSLDALSLKDNSELFLLWQEIAVGECITYLQYRLQKIGFDFSPGPKTRTVFKKLLENFSVSQIYYIIWCKVNDASRWYLEGNGTKQHAANSVIGACERYGENAIYYERELPQYRRPAECARSVLTQFFYNRIINLGPNADDICPSIIFVSKLIENNVTSSNQYNVTQQEGEDASPSEDHFPN